MSSNQLDEFEVATFSKTGDKLYLDEKFADIHFVLKTVDGQDKRIPAHKLILSRASDVFEAMFKKSWPEQEEIKITDVPASAFEEFFQFIYLAKIKLTVDNVERVMYLGEKYNVAECVKICAKYLRRILVINNLFGAYQLAILFNQHDLKAYCELLISYDTKAILLSSNFLRLDKEYLHYILKMDTLSCSEAELFDACMAWVQIASKNMTPTKEIVKTYLGDAFYDIRYRSMPIKDFAELHLTYGRLFTLDEHREVIQLVANTNYKPQLFNGNCWQKFQFNITDKIECTHNITRNWSNLPYSIKPVEVMRFSTNEPLLLLHFEFNQISGPVKSYSTEVTLVQTYFVKPATSNEEIILFNAKHSLRISDLTSISLPQPVLLKPGFIYEIRLRFKKWTLLQFGAATMMESKESKIHIQPDIVVRFHGDSVLDEPFVRGFIHKFTFHKV